MMKEDGQQAKPAASGGDGLGQVQVQRQVYDTLMTEIGAIAMEVLVVENKNIYENKCKKVELPKLDLDTTTQLNQSDDLIIGIDTDPPDTSEKKLFPESIAAAVKLKKRAASKNVQEIIQKQLSSHIKMDLPPTTTEDNQELNKDDKIDATQETALEGECRDDPDINNEDLGQEVFPNDRCANCLRIFDETDAKLSCIIPETTDLSILEALYSVFRIPINNSDDEDCSEYNLLFCSTCSNLLSSLYSTFQEFMALARESSFIKIKLRNLDEEMAQLRRKGRRRPKNPIKLEPTFYPESPEEYFDFEHDDELSADEDFLASDLNDSDTNSSSDDSDYHSQKKRKQPCGKIKSKKLKMSSKSDMDSEFTNIDDRGSTASNSQLTRKKKRRYILEKVTYTCNICENMFKRPRELRRHLREHRPSITNNVQSLPDVIDDEGTIPGNIIDNSLYKCPTCQEDFDSSISLSLHQLQEHDDNKEEPELSACSKPEKTFSDPTSLQQRHEMVNRVAIAKVDEPYKCSKCSMSFRRADVFHVHWNDEHANVRINEDKLPLEQKPKAKRKRNLITCKVCGKIFVRQDQFIQHSRVHTGEKPFSCKICAKAFSDTRGLAYHELTHSDTRNYCCTICGMRFKRLHHLNDHENNHRENIARPFSCGTCEKTFKHKKHLNTHLITHGTVNKHLCKICDKKFTRKDNLRQHVRNVHGRDPKEVDSTTTNEQTGEKVMIMTTTSDEVPIKAIGIQSVASTTVPDAIAHTASIPIPINVPPTTNTIQLENVPLEHVVYISL